MNLAQLHVSYLASIFFEVIKIYTFVYTYVKFTRQWKSSLRFVTDRKKNVPELSYGGILSISSRSHMQCFWCSSNYHKHLHYKTFFGLCCYLIKLVWIL